MVALGGGQFLMSEVPLHPKGQRLKPFTKQERGVVRGARIQGSPAHLQGANFPLLLKLTEVPLSL